jgi:3-phenylpropionate/trans-cinnamate dioxygenase ferredoxin reductase subunit
MSVRDVDHLLIGGGLACATAAQALREAGSEESIMLVGREPDPPYERPPCSKGYLQGVQPREETFVAPAEWYEQHGVELLTRTSVTKLDLAARTAELSTREQVRFEKALLATGANVNRLHVDGGELEGLHYLRTLANADAIRADAESAEHVVLVGGSYIACEVAASLTVLGKRCTMVMQEDYPLQRTFGEAAGRFFEEVLRSHGVEIHGADELERFEGSGRVSKVRTSKGLELAAELVVIGAGVTPEVRLARAAGLEIGERGGVRCSSRLETGVSGVFAAGDMCEYESPMHDGPMRIEHWDVAFNQGRTAALNMLGAEEPYEVVPYFFSDLADWASFEYVGPAFGWEEEVLRGSFADGEFTNWYVDAGRVRAALTLGRSKDLEHARRMISAGADLDASHRALLADPDGDLATLASTTPAP